ncbi:hypothetical protein, partial [Aneurinibacillus migulanus]|uniref:hypothetical protein n=1 Tax=Aneurinibacillus migulanus TaxID=47500 RepID=UPI003D1D1B6A
AEERQTCFFPTTPAHRPSFFSYLLPQEFVDLSNQMYIGIFMLKDEKGDKSIGRLFCNPVQFF